MKTVFLFSFTLGGWPKSSRSENVSPVQKGFKAWLMCGTCMARAVPCSSAGHCTPCCYISWLPYSEWNPLKQHITVYVNKIYWFYFNILNSLLDRLPWDFIGDSHEKTCGNMYKHVQNVRGISSNELQHYCSQKLSIDLSRWPMPSKHHYFINTATNC